MNRDTVRHKKKGRQLGRQTKHRWALFRSLVTSLLEHERIETTEAKAKEIRGFTDRMISLGKDGSLPARRRALSFLRSKAVVSEAIQRCRRGFRDRPGGYTRIIRTRRRVGDAAEMVAMELVDRPAAPAASSSSPMLQASQNKDTICDTVRLLQKSKRDECHDDPLVVVAFRVVPPHIVLRPLSYEPFD